ncbi:MAG: EipA family protein [Sphingomonadales bacterium]
MPMFIYLSRFFSTLLILGLFSFGFSFSAQAQKKSTLLPLETYSLEEVLEAAGEFFGPEYSEALRAVIKRAFADKGAPDAYYFGEEDAGITEIGYRFGDGRFFSKNLTPKKVFWRGPAIGFELVGETTKIFTLVYNVRTYKDLYKVLPSGETGYYFFGGAAVSYKTKPDFTNPDLTLAQIRVGVEVAEGLNPAWIKLAGEKMVVPKVIPK